jgi:hypothetical protein
LYFEFGYMVTVFCNLVQNASCCAAMKHMLRSMRAHGFAIVKCIICYRDVVSNHNIAADGEGHGAEA